MHRIRPKLSLLFVFLICTAFQVQAKIKYVTVKAIGEGISEHQAITNALINGVSQVNGAAVASSTRLKTKEDSVNGGVSSSQSYQENISSKTNGLVKSYKILKTMTDSSVDGQWKATLQVTIAKYASSKQVNRLRMAVLPFTFNQEIQSQKNPLEFQKNMTRGLVSYLTQSRKFLILDRDNMGVQDEELAMIRRGQMPMESLAKLGQKLSTDYIVLGDIDEIYYSKKTKKMKLTGKILENYEQGARVSYQIIDVATGQVKYSEVFDQIINRSSKIRDAANLAQESADMIGQVILNAIFPIKVESLSNQNLYLGQGGITIKKGHEYHLIMLGRKLKSTDTGESLGREEREVGLVKITQVQAKTSTAIIISETVDVVKLFKPGLFILRPKVQGNLQNIIFEEKSKTAKTSIDAFEKSVEEDW